MRVLKSKKAGEPTTPSLMNVGGAVLAALIIVAFSGWMFSLTAAPRIDKPTELGFIALVEAIESDIKIEPVALNLEKYSVGQRITDCKDNCICLYDEEGEKTEYEECFSRKVVLIGSLDEFKGDITILTVDKVGDTINIYGEDSLKLVDLEAGRCCACIYDMSGKLSECIWIDEVDERCSKAKHVGDLIYRAVDPQNCE
jgi:hypothetical protein